MGAADSESSHNTLVCHQIIRTAILMFMHGTWRILLGLVGLAACSMDPAATRVIPPFVVPPARPDVTYVRFMAIGDMGTGLPGQHAVAAAMAERAREVPVDFILTVGDNFYPAGVSSVTDPQWQTKFENVYDDEALQVPVYATLGNHDHSGNITAQIDYTEGSERWNMPAAYYSFTRSLDDGATVQFFALDTEVISVGLPAMKEQLDWLDGELAASTARWKVVYGHHPLYGHNPDRGPNQRMIEYLDPLLVCYGVDLYLAGHDHALEMINPVGGVHHVITGGGGGPEAAYEVDWTDESSYAATLGGFTLYRASRDELVVEFVRMNGETEYAKVLRKDSVRDRSADSIRASSGAGGNLSDGAGF